MTAEQKVLDALEELGIEHEAITIDPAFADTAVFCEKYGFTAEQSANTIIVGSKKEPRQYCACLVLANTRLDVNKKVTRLMGVSKASFASAEEMQMLTGMRVGGVTPFALPKDLPLYVDARVMQQPWIIIGGGGRSLKIRMNPAELLKLGARVIEGLAMATPA